MGDDMDSVEVEVAKKFIKFITGVARVRATIELLGGNDMTTDRRELVKTFIEELERHGVTLQIVDHDARIDAEIRATRENKALWSRIKEQDRRIHALSDELCDLKMSEYQAEIARLVKEKEEQS
jgi:hypothetical protein